MLYIYSLRNFAWAHGMLLMYYLEGWAKGCNRVHFSGTKTIDLILEVKPGATLRSRHRSYGTKDNSNKLNICQKCSICTLDDQFYSTA